MSEQPDRIRVLLVDDDPDFAARTAGGLDGADDRFDVVTAAAASDALAVLAEGDVDCVVSEYAMADADGIEFLEAVRETHGDLPFLLLTGEGSEAVASEAISAGVTDYLRKGQSTGRSTPLADRIRTAVERARSTRAFEDRERRLETLVGNLPGLVYRCRNEPGWPMEYVAGDCEPVTGYPADALETGAVSWGTDVVHPDDRGAARKAVQDALAAGEAFEFTYRITTADGATRWVWERGRGVGSTADDVAILEGFISDVTDRTEREAALRELHSVATDIRTYDTPAAVCERTVEAAESILAFDLCAINLEENGMLPITAISEETPPDGAATMSVEEGLVGKTYRTGETIRAGDAQALPEANPQGPYRAVLSIPIGDHGVFQAVSEDVDAFDADDQELAELLVSHAAQALTRLAGEAELHQQNERLDEFASVVSHDLRNPLNVAQGHLELARNDCESPGLDAVARAHDRMETLIDDLLGFARQGEAATDVEPLDLRSTLRSCWSTVETGAASLVVDTDVVVRADRGRLRQLLENLFRNAVEHGGGDVTVRCGALETGFYVEDDGRGIPADRREAVFDPGYSTAQDGTGFGLAIVREIAHAHGWEVTVRPGLAAGARFEFTGVELVER